MHNPFFEGIIQNTSFQCARPQNDYKLQYA